MLKALVLDYGGVLTDPGEDNPAEPPLLTALRKARQHGLKTALLSNADGWWQPPGALTAVLDAAVISGEVGLVKPDTEIYLLTATRLNVKPEECVFVDDLAVNVRGAAKAGMVGVHHRSTRSTLEELEILLAIALRD
ncbi:haloacid dehalogenase superfamily, subfamily IA, variant 3 with third motif having DD or ED [Lentzea albidocapillata subsp. violacea]|uniref:Haloacid dehalogenase superfamily, subfamily IA, variant 3 with third motif having DD or ED n=1 Tax=Lentzea albidocapillata subsp. violacea TaxID=128104 RepID=A0A1G8WV22_9PSEU|nr:HAD-IA family hydrolase [Lentzea albidocapillata]SDJ81906.1 haloacid dehalogenase superfamily, subfamily IA, variant 3 with third motif having DD or ED [Lentzea albidocapillata subsp. violacea]